MRRMAGLGFRMDLERPSRARRAIPASRAVALLTAVALALKHVKPDKLWLNPDCGLMITPRWIGKAKLRALVDGARLVRKELAG